MVFKGFWPIILVVFVAQQSAGAARADERADAIASMMAGVVGTTSVLFEPFMYKGELAGCQLVYEAVHQDFTYWNGGYLRVSGSVGILAVGSPGVTVKTIVKRIDFSSDMKVNFIDSPPTRTYIVGTDLQTNSSALKGSGPAEDPAGLFAVFSANESFPVIASSMAAGQLTIAFNQSDGDSDIRLPVDLSVIRMGTDGQRTRSPEALNQFTECLGAIIKKLD